MEGFNERLRLLMKLKGINQKELADGIGITRQSVSLYVNGERNPDITILHKICTYLDISADFLLGLNTDSQKQNEFIEISYDKIIRLENKLATIKQIVG